MKPRPPPPPWVTTRACMPASRAQVARLLKETTTTTTVVERVFAPPAPEPPVPAPASHVHVARSQPRNVETGAICFDVTYPDNSWSRVPIYAFIDTNLKFKNHDVADAVNDWLATAERTPSIRRNCLCCNRRAIKGMVLCTKCMPKWGKAVYP